MANRDKYESNAFEAIHSAVSALHGVGAIGKATMRTIDAVALSAPPALAPADIRRIREEAKVSQALFARRLNTSASTVEKWETGAKRPSGLALKMLTVVRKHGLAVLD